MKFIISIALCAALFFTESASAESTVKERDFPYGKRFELVSSQLGTSEKFDVYLPPNYHLDSTNVTYPLVLTLDGWTLSQSVSGVVGHLTNTAAFPKSVVVSLHTDIWPYLPNAYVHSTDNWPADEKDGFARAFKRNGENASEKFWRFLQEELLPHLESTYRINDFRTLIGMSPTAIMALHTMLQKADMFDAYVLLASTDVLGLGYNPQRDFVDEITHKVKRGQLDGKYLYVASAEFEARRENAHYKNVEKLNQNLKEYAQNFTLQAEHIDGYGHYPVAIPALLNAFDLIFPRAQFQKYVEYLNQGGNVIENLSQHYNDLSEQYGFTLHPQTAIQRNPNSLRAIGYRLMRIGELKQAKLAFEKWVTLSVKDPSAHFWLARVESQLENKKQAIESMNKALALAKQYTPDSVSAYKNALERLKGQ